VANEIAGKHLKSQGIALPALQHQDLIFIRVAHAAFFYQVGQPGTTNPLKF
jgi:hypothetical protein